jgi:hypothetical protein
MEFYALDRGFKRQTLVDEFESAIWTDRFAGDGEFQLSVDANNDVLASALLPGTLMEFAGSKEPMITQEYDIENGLLKVTGISLMQWLNNRFIRASAAHEDRYWVDTSVEIMSLMNSIVQNWCIDSDYLNGVIPMGIPFPQYLKIPGLTTVSVVGSGVIGDFSIPYGPVYDALKAIASPYNIGLKIMLTIVTDTSYTLEFHPYQGKDRMTGNAGGLPVVRFSPKEDTLANIKEVQTNADEKNLSYVFAPSNPGGLATDPGIAGSGITSHSDHTDKAGFDLLVSLAFAEDITTDQVGGSAGTLQAILDARAREDLAQHSYFIGIDGQIVPGGITRYNDFDMGDVVEVEGNSGTIKQARVTEYIYAQDSAGSREYPTLSLIN